MTRIYIALCALFFACPALMAQLNPVLWTFSAEKVSAQEYDLILTASIDPGWFVYSQYLESDEGPVRTSLMFKEDTAFALEGKAEEKGKKKEGYDALFDMNLVKFGGTTQFVQRIKLLDKLESVSGSVEFMCCDDARCLPPQNSGIRY